MTTYYRLEYNERQGGFHYNNGGQEPETFGWVTICASLSHENCDDFVNKMNEKYPATNWTYENRKDYPSAETIKKEFRDFLLT